MINPCLKRLQDTARFILNAGDEVFAFTQHGMTHIKPDNDWRYPRMARAAMTLAAAWGSPACATAGDPALWAAVLRIVDAVLDGCREGRWWRGESGTGDRNINRFALLPLCETFLLVQSRMSAGARQRTLDVIRQAAEFQVQDYLGTEARRIGEYPNMDAYFMLVMEEASRILNRNVYHRHAVDFLGFLETCLFPGGGFTYFKDTNECPVYHQINVMCLVRLYQLGRSARVLDLLRKTLPYYVNLLEPCGAAENFTDPFWKHIWKPVEPYALLALASLFPEAPEAGQHRYYGRLLMDTLPEVSLDNVSLYLPWTMDAWSDDPGEKPPERRIVYDPSIRGTRGREGAFSWAATTGACVDTLVGAMVARSPASMDALQAVGVDVRLEPPPVTAPASPHFGRRVGTSAYVTGREYPRRVVAAPGFAGLAVWPRVFPGQIAWNENEPASGWIAPQAWLMTPERVTGALWLETEPGAAAATEASVYLRLGGGAVAAADGPGFWRHGDLRVRVAFHSFASERLLPAYEFYFDELPKSHEIVLSSSLAGAEAKRFVALVEVFPAWEHPSDLRMMDNAPGFVCGQRSGVFRVVFNASSEPCALAPVDRAECWLGEAGQPARSSSAAPSALAPGDFAILVV